MADCESVEGRVKKVAFIECRRVPDKVQSCHVSGITASVLSMRKNLLKAEPNLEFRSNFMSD